MNVADFLGLQALATSLEGARYLLPLDGLWRGTEFALEPQAILLLVQAGGDSRAARIVANSPFYAASGPPPAFMLYVALWTVAVLSLAIVSFRRREI